MKRLLVLVVLLVVPILVIQWRGSRRSTEHAFACGNGASIGATYGDNRMTLRLPAGSAELPIAASASGARYANDTLEFWEHAGEARVSLRGATILDGCRPTP